VVVEPIRGFVQGRTDLIKEACGCITFEVHVAKSSRRVILPRLAVLSKSRAEYRVAGEVADPGAIKDWNSTVNCGINH